MSSLEILPNTNKETGQALIAAIAAIAILSLIAVAVLALATGQLTISAHDRDSLRALNIADAGVNHALWAIENVPGYSGSSGSAGGGEYVATVTSETDGGNQYQIIDSRGFYPNQTSYRAKRKIRARVQVVPKVLTNSIFAVWNIFAGGATKETFLAPLDWHSSGARGGDLGSDRDIVFQDKAIRLNYRDAASPGTYDSLFGPPNPPTSPVPRGNILVKGQVKGPAGQVYTTIDQLKADFKYLDMAAIIPLATEIILPKFDFSTYIAMAQNNTTDKPSLGHNGYYTSAEFAGLFTSTEVQLSGMIYVDGNVTIPNNKTLRITNGGLVVKGNVTVNNRGSLIITHDASTENYPGLFSYSVDDPATLGAGQGSLVTIMGTANIEGLIYAEMAVIWNGYAQVKGGVVVSNRQSVGDKGFENQNSTIVIQYDPAIQSTIGVKSFDVTYNNYSLSVKKIIFWREVAP